MKITYTDTGVYHIRLECFDKALNGSGACTRTKITAESAKRPRLLPVGHLT